MSNNSKEQDPSCTEIRARIVRIEESYAVAYPLTRCGDLQASESVTFSLSGWRGEHAPQCGDMVVLIDTALWRHGWRANAARPVTLRNVQQQKQRSI